MTDITTLRDALQELVDRDCRVFDRTLEIAFESNDRAYRAVRLAREAYRACGSDSAPDESQTALRLTHEPQGDAGSTESLRADAARYRWLRDVGDATWRPFGLRHGYSAAQADAEIDRAMIAAAKEPDRG